MIAATPVRSGLLLRAPHLIRQSHVLPAVAARPLTVSVSGYKQDEPSAAAAKPEQQVARQQDAAAQVAAPAPRMVHPARVALRLPSLFHEMQREMDAMTRTFGLPSMAGMFDVDDLFSSSLRHPAASSMLGRLQQEMPPLPTMRVAVDVEETDTEYVIKADTPGIPKESLKLSVLDGTLTISGERREEKQEGGEEEAGEEGQADAAAAAPTAGSKAPQAVVRVERSYGSFSRSFSLPANVDAQGISAEAKDGVLTVRIPKVPEQKPQAQEIPIN